MRRKAWSSQRTSAIRNDNGSIRSWCLPLSTAQVRAAHYNDDWACTTPADSGQALFEFSNVIGNEELLRRRKVRSVNDPIAHFEKFQDFNARPPPRRMLHDSPMRNRRCWG
jgi:hypothetical protein